MTPLTLRTRLTLLYAGVLALLFTTLGVAYSHAFARQLDIDATTTLSEITSGVHGYLRFERGMPMLDYDRSDPAQVSFIEEATRYYQVYDVKTGQLLVQSPALEPLGVQYTPAEVRAFGRQPRVQEVETDQRRIRFSNSVITPGDGGRYLLQVGVPLDPMDEALDRFLRLLLWSVPAAIFVGALTSRWIAGRALVPLVRLAEATRAIDVADLRRRLPIRGAGDELDEVAQSFNGALARLEQAVTEMRQFSTAIAHELRTPLAALRGETELALIQARSPEEYRRGLESQLESLDRLARLISQLLTLARAEAGDIPLKRELVDLGALSASVVEQLEPVAYARGVTLGCQAVTGEFTAGCLTPSGDAVITAGCLTPPGDVTGEFTAGCLTPPAGESTAGCLTPPGDVIGEFTTGCLTPPGDAVITGDPGWIERLLLNLLDNAIKFTPAGGRVTVRVIPDGAFAKLEVEDTGVGLQGGGEGGGLGLRLVKWIADRHQATIDVASRPGAGTTFTLKFPGRA